jgi:SCY1-like protein 1
MNDNVPFGAANGPSTTTQANAAQAGGNSLVGTAAGAAGALAGWAISSLNKQLPSNEAHSQMSATPAQVQKPLELPRPTSEIFNSTSNVPSPAVSPRPSFGDVSRQTPGSSTSKLGGAGRFGASAAGSRAGGMQLGGSSRVNQKQQKEVSSLADTLAAEYEEEEGSVGDAWGDGDLMDVNADADDWSESQLIIACGGFLLRG